MCMWCACDVHVILFWKHKRVTSQPLCTLSWILTAANRYTLTYESVLVPHSSLKCNSKFRVWTRNFQLGCRNFQFVEVEISSLNSKFPVGMSKFPVFRSRNFEFELEISSWDVEISSLPKSKLYTFHLSEAPCIYEQDGSWIAWHFYCYKCWLQAAGNFDILTRNFDFVQLEILTSQLEISSSNGKFRLRQTGNFEIRTGNFEFELEISTSSNWKFRHSNWKFRVRTGNFHFLSYRVDT